MYKDMQELAINYQKDKHITEEIILVLIVYETPSNHCSERQALQDYFQSHGIDCTELEYPIQQLEIKKGEFKF